MSNLWVVGQMWPICDVSVAATVLIFPFIFIFVTLGHFVVSNGVPDRLKSAATSPLVSSVLVSSQPAGQVEGAVGGQPGVHPLGEVKDLGRREGVPLPLFPLQPALAAAGGTFLSPPENHNFTAECVSSLHFYLHHQPSSRFTFVSC